MAFELNLQEPTGDGVRRSAISEMDKALEHLAVEARASDEAHVEAIHEVRKCFKRVRAALRLVRDELGEKVYREENACFRDAGRPLAAVRDAQVLVETFDHLAPTRRPLRMRHALLENEKRVSGDVPPYGDAFAEVRRAILGARARAATWNIEPRGWRVFDAGVRRVYRTGRRSLAVAKETPTVDHLHELRKQTKYLWHILQLLKPGWIAQDKDLGARARELSQVLGDDHDLAVLRETLASDPRTFGKGTTIKNVLSLIDLRREQLRRESFAFAEALYADHAQSFADRLEAYWNAAMASPALARG